MKLLHIKKYKDAEQVGLYTEFGSYEGSKILPTNILTLEGEMFKDLLGRHAGAFFQLIKEGEDSAGRAVYRTITAEELVDFAEEVSNLFIQKLVDNNWIETLTSELEVENIVRVAMEVEKASKK